MELSGIFSSHGNAKGELKIIYDIKKSDLPQEEKDRLIADMFAAGKQYGFIFSEYMVYDFAHKTPEEQHAFLSEKEHMKICRQMNTEEASAFLDDKYRVSQELGGFFRHGACLVSAKTADAFPPFARRFPRLFIKPNDDWGGASARTADLTEYDSAEQLLRELLEQYPDGCIAEERMANAEPFRSLHPASLNTVRMPTVLLPSGVKVVHPFARIGCGGAVVDNAAAGGIIGCIDVNTGRIFAACDEKGTRYDVHPDTGVPLIGFQIPAWDEACAFAGEIARQINGLHYCGWDIAYTERGWVLIEGNAEGQFVWQMAEQAGCRDEFEGYLKEIFG